MFIAALFTVVEIGKQLKCPSICDWIKKMCHTHSHTHTMEYYSAIRRDKMLPLVKTWMDLENIMLREMSD